MSPREYVLRDIPDWERAEDLDAYKLHDDAPGNLPTTAGRYDGDVHRCDRKFVPKQGDRHPDREPLRADFGGVGVAAEAAPRRALERKASV